MLASDNAFMNNKSLRSWAISALLVLGGGSALADKTALTKADNGGVVPGLYGATGQLLTSACSIDHIEYRLTYRTEPGEAIYYPSRLTKSYRSRISVKFTSAAWQGYRSAGALGVKVIDYAAYGAAALEQIVGDVGDGLSTAVIQAPTDAALPPSESTHTFTAIKPKKILFSSLTVDPKDTTGKTGYVEFDSPTATTSSWWSTEIPSGRTGTWFSAVWLFPQWTGKGLYDRKNLEPYAIEPIIP